MRYVLVADFVHSANDNDVHWIGVNQLIQLYKIDRRDVIARFRAPTELGNMSRHDMTRALLRLEDDIRKLGKNVIVLEPRYLGDYEEYLMKFMEKK